MKKGRVLKKLLSVCLAALFILEILPFTVFASAIDKYNHALEVQPEPSSHESSPVVHEVEELREENVKVYQRADGTYSAFVSSAPLHYLENEEWKDIDNTLVEKSFNSESVLTNKEGGCQVQIPSELSSDSEIILKNDNSQISFSMKNISASDGKVNNNISGKPAEELARLASIENKDSSVTFKNIKPDTDVEYIMGATSLKENIVINQKPSSAVDFTYELNTDGLTAVLNSDSSIGIYSGSETVYLIEAPYMLDSASNYSGDVYVSLDSLGGGKYQITYTPDFSFLSNEDTVYPVTVDPTINFYRKRNLNESCYGSYTAPDGADSTKEWFIQKYDSNNSEIYYRLPEGNFALSQNVVIKSAVLSAFCGDVGDNSANKNVVCARMITENWAEDTTALLNKSDNILDYNTVAAGDSAKRYYWNITEAAAKWSLGQSGNYGVALGSYGSGRCNVRVYKGENVYSNQMPWLVIDYEKTADSRNKFNFASVDMGRAGTVNINTHNGTLYLERNDLSLSGNLLPVATGSVYNPWSELDYNTNSSGAYWHNTYFLRLLNGGTVSETVDGTAYTRRVLKLAEGDTLVKEYQETSETDSDGLVKYKCLSDGGSYTLYADSSLNTTLDFSKVTVVENESGNKLSFTSNGKLNKITDKYSNQNTIEYSGNSSYTIIKITDGAGRAYIYSTKNVAGSSKIGELKVANSAGNTIKLGGEDFKITYSYTATGAKSVANLTSVTYPDGESISYEYTDGSILSAVENIDGSRLEISYANGRVSGYRKYVGANKLESGMDISYDSALQRTYAYYKPGSSQPYKSETVLYGSDLKEIGKISGDGKFSFSNYDSQGELTSDAYTKDSSVSELIVNGDFASSASWSSVPVGAGSVVDTEAIGRRTAENAKCFKLGGTYNSNARVYQTVNNLTVGGTYSFGAWAKAAACAGSDKTFGILIEDAENKIIGSYEFNKDYSDWQFGAASFIATTAAVKIYLIYDNQPSDAYFDGVTLFKSERAQVKTNSEGESTEDSESEDGNIPEAPVPASGYNAEPCKDCSCAQCTTAYYDASGNWLGYYKGHCSKEDEQHSSCGCLGCRQERGKTETKDSYGNTLVSSLSDGSTYTSTISTYTPNGNYLATSTDEHGFVIRYNYNADTGMLESTQCDSDEYDTALEYSYNAMGALTEISKVISNVEMSTQYTYSKDMLSSVSHGGTKYTFEYNEFGNTTAVKLNDNTTLVSYGYDSYQRNNSVTYANGTVLSYTYDSDDNITAIFIDGIKKYSYAYLENKLIKSFDYVNMVTATYTDEKLSAVKMFSLDASGNAVDGDTIYSVTVTDDKTTEAFYGRTYTSNAIKETYDPDNDTVVKSGTYGSGTNSEFNVSKSTDFFDREVSSQIQYKSGTTLESQLDESVIYYSSSDTGTSEAPNTHRVSVTDSAGTKTYDYYKAYTLPGPRGDLGVYDYSVNGWDKTYRYDNAHQLIEEVDAKTGVGYKYRYDANGNIISRTEYSGIGKPPFILTTSTVKETRNYTYSSEWTDKLTSYNGQAITYDALGNPLSYKGATLTWQGRNLMTYTTSEQRVEYSYDADGLRTTKKVYDSQNRLNKTYIYTWSDSKLVGYKLSYTFYTPNSNTPTSGTVTVKYLYDNDGKTYGININGFDYYYVKDMQDNIVALISASSGKAVLLFDYTAYGIVTRTAPQDDETTLDSVADVSDFDDIFNQMQDLVFKMTTLVNCWLDSTLVYKDYSYDSDTGMYYLQSRYYDPEVGRFINTDDTNILRNTTGTINGANLFAYCNNDPVLNQDNNGYLSIKSVLSQIKKLVNINPQTLRKYLKNLVRKDKKRHAILISSDAISGVIDIVICFAVNRIIYRSVKLSMKLLLRNKYIRKTFLNTVFNFFIYNKIGKKLLWMIFKISSIIAGRPGIIKTMSSSLFVGYISSIISLRPILLKKAVYCISSLASIGGIIALLLDCSDRKLDQQLTIKYK